MMDNKAAVASETFRAQAADRREEARQLMPLLVPGMSIKRVEDLLGLPTDTAWIYALSDSASLVLRFNPDGNLHAVSPSGTDLAPQATGKDVARARKQFRSKSGDPKKASVALIDQLTTGMAREEIEDLLGRPDERVWSYDLFYSAALDVFLNREQEVKQVHLVGV